MAEINEFPIRWTTRFMRADAEQRVGTMLSLLSNLRSNQWILLGWQRLRMEQNFYPFKKRELVVRLETDRPFASVANALGLESTPSSQVVRSEYSLQYLPAERIVKALRGKFTTGEPTNTELPWLPRKVAVDSSGYPVAVGFPSIPRKASTVREKALASQPREEVIGEMPMPSAEPRDYRLVQVFYATDRAKGTGSHFYSSLRNADESLRYGICDVSIPSDHNLAKLESPKWWHFEFTWNPDKHVALLNTYEKPEDEFFRLLRERVSDDPDRSALVFIHGFNSTFEDAARRTAQLTYDLGYQGAPILYSWPSGASLLKYFADETSIEWTKPHLQSFLAKLALVEGICKIHVVAHSMGNRALTKILQPSVLSHGLTAFNQIVLAAPDIDTAEFLQLASQFNGSADRITLYASSNDNAIKASKVLHSYPRAGESGDDIVIAAGVDTVDASTVDTSFMGHSYFADKRNVLSDLFYLIREGKPPGERFGLEFRANPRGGYWAFKP
jgi:esterase/lipase superfamily enzyme